MGQEGVNLILFDGVNIPIAELSLESVKNILVSGYRIFFWSLLCGSLNRNQLPGRFSCDTSFVLG